MCRRAPSRGACPAFPGREGTCKAALLDMLQDHSRTAAEALVTSVSPLDSWHLLMA